MYMRKLLFIFTALLAVSAAQARTADVTAAYTHGSHFDQGEAGFTVAPALNVLTGLEARYVKEDAFDDAVYSVYLPIHFDFEILKINLTPFYYFKNKSEDKAYQDASAFGVKGMLVMNMQEDTVNDLYTRAFIGASFAREKGTVFFDDDSFSNEYYSQAAYTLGVYKDFYRAFGFEASGTVYHYPDGVDGVAGLRSIMNQQDLASTQTFDVMHSLGKYALSARLMRMWAETGATIYLGYTFSEFHDSDPEHSAVIGNSFILAKRLSVDMGYNHVRTVHNQNRRDILYVRLGMSL